MDALPILREPIYRYHQVNPWDRTISQVIHNFSANHSGQKLINPIIQIEDSILQGRKSDCTWWTYVPRSATTLNVLSRKIRNLFFNHRRISLCANFPGSQIALSRDCHESINNKFHDYKYLLLRYLSVLYTPTKTGECWISSSGFYLVSRNIPSWVVNLRMDLILGGFQEQVVRQLTGWIPQRW